MLQCVFGAFLKLFLLPGTRVESLLGCLIVSYTTEESSPGNGGVGAGGAGSEHCVDTFQYHLTDHFASIKINLAEWQQ